MSLTCDTCILIPHYVTLHIGKCEGYEPLPSSQASMSRVQNLHVYQCVANHHSYGSRAHVHEETRFTIIVVCTVQMSKSLCCDMMVFLISLSI